MTERRTRSIFTKEAGRKKRAGDRTTLAGPVLAALLVPGLALGLLPKPAAAEIVQGVDFGAVPWHSFCPSVEPVPLKTGAGECPVSHPAAARHARYIDYTGRGVEPPPQCGPEKSTYERATTPSVGRSVKDPDPRAWAFCGSLWRRALNLRAQEPERFDEPLAVWRSRYFGPWVVGGER
jgi:hypothetical protein